MTLTITAVTRSLTGNLYRAVATNSFGSSNSNAVLLGVNSTLVNDITIGRDTWLGPHVTVTRDAPPGSVYRPARSERREVSSYELFGVEA